MLFGKPQMVERSISLPKLHFHIELMNDALLFLDIEHILFGEEQLGISVKITVDFERRNELGVM